MRKFLIAAAMLLCFQFSVVGQIVIGDFEDGDITGWQIGGAVGELTTDWSSSGTTSLRFDLNNLGFCWCLAYESLENVPLLAKGHVLAFEVHWVSSEWTDPEGDGWVRWDTASLNSAGDGWMQITDNEIDDPENPDFPGSWDPSNWGDEHTRTLTYDFTGLNYDFADSEWAQLNIAVNFGNIDLAGAGSFYIDNVRIESLSEVLLGDVNLDGAVDLLDVTPFVELLTQGGYLAEADINQDGVVDLLDVSPFVELLSGG